MNRPELLTPRPLLVWLLTFIFIPPALAAQITPRNFAVELTATVAANPPEITLHWVGDQYARAYKIFRKRLHEGSWNLLGTVDGSATSYLDRQVSEAQGFEYKVVKEGALGYTGYGYIYSGINLPLPEYRGKVILVAEKSAAEALRAELTRFEYDLIGDGWSVARVTVERGDSPQAVKQQIKAIYDRDTFDTQAVILFGDIPVPYSGDIAPDEHDNHRGAWPADVYYGDMNGTWTDHAVTSTGAEGFRSHNVPGDGKFDQSEPPSHIELQVGRIDLSAMTCFLNKSPSRNEMDLLRGYLDKNHRFRHGIFKPRQQAMLFDRLGMREPEAMSAMAWRNFTPILGRNIVEVGDNEYFTAAGADSFLWSAVCAGGGYNHADRVGTSDGFALHPVNVVFASFIGSYYGDWDNESNFLRAALGANGGVLASIYSGKPQWLLHPMAMGETIGHSTKITQENSITGVYLPFHPGNGQVHIALMGDPTLRAHPVEPVANLRGRPSGSSMILEWSPSPAPRIQAVRIYRAATPAGPFRRIAQVVPGATSFTAPDYKNGEVFMVRAIAVAETPSGTYLNASQGVYTPDPLSEIGSEPPSAPASLVVTKVSSGSVSIAWLSTSASEAGFIIQRKRLGDAAFQEIARIPADSESFTDNAVPGEGSYVYRVAAVNNSATSDFSNEAIASTLAGAARFIGADAVSKGNWFAVYGSEGHAIPGQEQSLPAFVSLSVSNAFLYRDSLTDDPRGPELTLHNGRSANAWVGGTPFAFEFRFSDGRPHRVSLYVASWSRRNEEVRVVVSDLVTGRVLDERVFGQIDEGMHLSYVLSRQVRIEVGPKVLYDQAEVYGIFLDPVELHPVRIDPAGGEFNSKAAVSMASATPGAEIRYTTDGSTPSASSPRYVDPLWISSNTRLRARAFFDESGGPVSEASFTNRVVNSVAFKGWDDQTSGNWAARYGSSGYAVPTAGKYNPPSFQLSMSGASEWIWNEVTDDPRAPFTDSSATRRRGSAWFTGTSMTFDLNVADSRQHTVALYFVDFDRLGREQTVELIDASGAVVTSHLLRDFQNGRYFVIQLSGSARVKVTRRQGGNAVLSGIFAQGEPGPIGPAAPLRISPPKSDSGYYYFNVYGTPGSRFCLDRSSDLRQWTCTETNTFQGSGFMLFPKLGTESGRFFRTHAVP